MPRAHVTTPLQSNVLRAERRNAHPGGSFGCSITTSASPRAVVRRLSVGPVTPHTPVPPPPPPLHARIEPGHRAGQGAARPWTQSCPAPRTPRTERLQRQPTPRTTRPTPPPPHTHPPPKEIGAAPRPIPRNQRSCLALWARRALLPSALPRGRACRQSPRRHPLGAPGKPQTANTFGAAAIGSPPPGPWLPVTRGGGGCYKGGGRPRQPPTPAHLLHPFLYLPLHLVLPPCLHVAVTVSLLQTRPHWGRFHTAPIITLFIPGTPLKTTPLQKKRA